MSSEGASRKMFKPDMPDELDDVVGRLPSQQFRALANAGFLPDLLPGVPPHANRSPTSKMSSEIFEANAGKFPGKRLADGSWVGFHKWQNHQTTEADVEEWETWTDASVCVNARRMAAVDIDVTDADLAQDIEDLATRMLGPAPRRVGNWPKRLMPYRVSLPISKMRVAFEKDNRRHAIEILGQGEHFVFYGVHPKTGSYYTWQDLDLNTGFEGWPLVTPDQVEEFLDAVATLLAQRGCIVCTPSKGLRTSNRPGRPAPSSLVLDDPSSIARAISYLKGEQPAIEGANGDDTTLRVANRCLDLGLSNEKTLEVMLKHWNDRCVPPWQEGDLATKVRNAANSRQNEVGCDYVGSASEAFGEAFAALGPKAPAPAHEDDITWPPDTELIIPFAEHKVDHIAFEREMVPSVIADHAFDVADSIGTAPVVCALALISAAGTALGLEFAIQPKADPDYVERPALWVALITKSGGGKSPAKDKAIEALRPIEKRWHEEDSAKFARYKQDKALYSEKIKVWKQGVTVEGQPLVGDQVNPVPDEPVKPPYRQVLFGDTTLEALADTMVANPRGLLGVYDELTAMFGGFDAYRQAGGKKPSKDRASFLQAWSGGEYRVDRKGSDTKTRIANFQFSLLGGIQPRKLAKMAVNGGMDDDGMIQRFLFAVAGSEPKPIERAPNAAARDAYHSAIDALSRLVPGDPVRLSPEATQVRLKLADYIHDLKEDPSTSDVMREWLSKAPAQFARLCLIFHALEHVNRSTASILPAEMPPAVEGGTAQMVATFMLDCLIPSAKKVLGELSPNPVEKFIAKVCNTILANGHTLVTERVIYKAHHELQHDRQMIQNVMVLLCGYGWAVEIQRSWRGAVAWKINPAVHRILAERAARAREVKEQTIRSIKRREATRAAIRQAEVAA